MTSVGQGNLTKPCQSARVPVLSWNVDVLLVGWINPPLSLAQTAEEMQVWTPNKDSGLVCNSDNNNFFFANYLQCAANPDSSHYLGAASTSGKVSKITVHVYPTVLHTHTHKSLKFGKMFSYNTHIWLFKLFASKENLLFSTRQTVQCLNLIFTDRFKNKTKLWSLQTFVCSIYFTFNYFRNPEIWK